VREHGDEAERNRDRGQRDQERHEPGDSSSEHEEQDDQRRGQADLELPVLQVAL
jgi:hypothetical protein